MGRDESSIFWRNMALVVVFFTLTPIALIVSVISLISIGPSVDIKANIAEQPKVGVRVFASLPAKIPSVAGYATFADARPEMVRQYLDEYGSPLSAYADKIVQIADKYDIDYRFIPAIAQQESNLCRVIPPGSHNCWGWGITSVSSLAFDSYDEAIETVTRGLKFNYIDEGLVTPNAIMSKYTPQSNGSWARGVSAFMTEISNGSLLR